MRDVWDIHARPGVGHPSHRPVELYDHMLKVTGKPGCTLLELFRGAGPDAVAAMRRGMKSHSIDKEPTYMAMMAQQVQRGAIVQRTRSCDRLTNCSLTQFIRVYSGLSLSLFRQPDANTPVGADAQALLVVGRRRVCWNGSHAQGHSTSDNNYRHTAAAQFGPRDCEDQWHLTS